MKRPLVTYDFETDFLTYEENIIFFCISVCTYILLHDTAQQIWVTILRFQNTQKVHITIHHEAVYVLATIFTCLYILYLFLAFFAV
jgi:hypothetical protein